MSNTRTKATNDGPPADERFMSSREFSDRRPLAGNLVAEKAALYPERRHREMLYFLQAVSLRPGGLKELAQDILSAYPERLGSPAMRVKGQVPPAASYSPDLIRQIETELDLERRLPELRRRDERRLAQFLAADDEAGQHAGGNAFIDVCKALSCSLPEFLRELCLNPAIDLEDLEKRDWCREAGYFTGLWSALQTFKIRAESPAANGVETNAGRIVADTLNCGLRLGRITVVEGRSGAGKSHAASAWARRHPSKVRYITLTGITSRTSFFCKVAESIGLATCQRKASELQTKIERFFSITGLMLVVDEAHYLFSNSVRVQTVPELIDWLMTALVNNGAAVALICTDQLAKRMDRVERQVGWNSDQLRNRTTRYVQIPDDAITNEDLLRVAENLLAMQWNHEAEKWQHADDLTLTADGRAVKMIAGFAGSPGHIRLPALRNAVDEARAIALEAGRAVVTFADAQEACIGRQSPSTDAMQRAFESGRKSRDHRQSGTRAVAMKVFKQHERATSLAMLQPEPSE